MKEKTTTIAIDDFQYQISRLVPGVGSWILGRILNATVTDAIQKVKALGDDFVESSKKPEEGAPTEKLDTATQISRVVTTAFGAMSFEDRSLIQLKCMERCARLEGPEGNLPMPLTSGSVIRPDIADDLQLVLRLEMEVLVFNLFDFFDQGGFNALLGTPAAPKK